MRNSRLAASLNTPCALINMDQLELNIHNMQRAADEAGVRLRPHVKVHQCADIAKMQVDAGACGIEVGAIEQAEAMADSGLTDIIVAHPFYGEQKIHLARKLLMRSNLNISFTVDMLEQAESIAAIGRELDRAIPILLKLDTGVARYGVPPEGPALELAKKLNKLPGIELTGIYAHESGANYVKGITQAATEVASMMSSTAKLLKSAGIELKTVAVGGSPTYYATCQLLKGGRYREINEVHPGTRVIGDISYLMIEGHKREECALSVLTTVMSTAHSDFFIIDAGYKTFGCESLIGFRDKPNFFWKGRPSFGSIQGRQDLWFGRVSAEVGMIYYMEGSKRDSKIGDRLEIVPNSATMVMNVHDRVYGVRNGKVEKVFRVTGREKGS